MLHLPVPVRYGAARTHNMPISSNSHPISIIIHPLINKKKRKIWSTGADLTSLTFLQAASVDLLHRGRQRFQRRARSSLHCHTRSHFVRSGVASDGDGRTRANSWNDPQQLGLFIGKMIGNLWKMMENDGFDLDQEDLEWPSLQVYIWIAWVLSSSCKDDQRWSKCIISPFWGHKCGLSILGLDTFDAFELSHGHIRKILARSEICSRLNAVNPTLSGCWTPYVWCWNPESAFWDSEVCRSWSTTLGSTGGLNTWNGQGWTLLQGKPPWVERRFKIGYWRDRTGWRSTGMSIVCQSVTSN